MEIYLELDYETGSQIEGGVHLPDLDTWLEDMLEGGQVQDPREGDEERRLVEEGAEGYLEKEGQCGKGEEEEDIMMVTEAGGGHKCVQDGQVGGAAGREVRLVSVDD